MNTAIAGDDEPVRLDFAPDVVSLYWVDNVAIMAWHRNPTAPVIDALHRAAEPQRRQFPSGMSFVHLGRVQLAMLDPEGRQAFVRVAQELGSYNVATAIVARASGFWASTLRSIATGIVVLARTPIDLRFHEHPEELLEWLPAKHEEKTGIKLDVDRLRRILLQAAHEIAMLDPATR
jgi:hypothetical protein